MKHNTHERFLQRKYILDSGTYASTKNTHSAKNTAGA